MSTTDLSAYDPTKVPHGAGLRIGIAVSGWNSEITENLYRGAFETLCELGVAEADIRRWDVPGSFELIYAASALQTSGQYDALIVLGSVIRISNTSVRPWRKASDRSTYGPGNKAFRQ